MSPMVERVARALYESNPFFESGEALDGFEASPGGFLSWGQCCDGYPEYVQTLHEEARAAIEAMRQATGPMLQAGADAHGATDSRSAGAYAIGVQDAADCWEAMIAAALSEDPTE